MSNSLTTIPLCQLKRSKTNIRKTEPLVDIEQMAASIESKGLLENLVVRLAEQSGDAEKGMYEVVAGGRRLAALKFLAKRKKIVRDHPVPCLVLENGSIEASVEISLAENIIRAPVHPADQFDAFARLQKEGLPAEDIAARFGLSPSVVVQRLKLASVSARLMAEYRSGEMTLEHLMAFTISDDHKAQEEAWFENPYGDSSPQAIRRRLTKSHVEGHDRRARFVGVKTYEEAGGIVVRDLFQPEDEGYFTDSQLLDRLVAAKLQAHAWRVKAEGWGWVEVMLKMDFDYLTRFGRIATTEIMLADEDEARLSALCERYDELVAAIDDDGEDEASEELDRVSSELELLRAKKEAWPEEKGHAGVVISLDYDGDVQVVRGLTKPGEQVNDEEAVVQSPTQPSRKEKSSNGYSDSLLADLSAHRTAALREVLASQPERALTALLHALAGRVFFNGPLESCIEITPAIVELGKFSETVGESKAAAALLARHNMWRERLPETTELWDWLEQLEQSERLELLAYCTGVTVNAVYDRYPGRNRPVSADVLARAVSLEMADWWRPTQAGFLDRVTKDHIVQAVTEGVSVQAARYLPELKKSQMSAKAEKLLADSRWIPEPLRTSTLGGESANEAPVAAAGE
jgi:ParB family transcriptional regulator, chromosome partitioning protein